MTARIDIPKIDQYDLTTRPGWFLWKPGASVYVCIRAGCCEFHLASSVHTIADDGTVTPSIGCPRYNDVGHFHVYGRLLDWTPVVRSR